MRSVQLQLHDLRGQHRLHLLHTHCHGARVLRAYGSAEPVLQRLRHPGYNMRYVVSVDRWMCFCGGLGAQSTPVCSTGALKAHNSAQRRAHAQRSELFNNISLVRTGNSRELTHALDGYICAAVAGVSMQWWFWVAIGVGALLLISFFICCCCWCRKRCM